MWDFLGVGIGINGRRKPQDAIDVHVAGVARLITERAASDNQVDNLLGIVVVEYLTELVEVTALYLSLVVDKEIYPHTDVQLKQPHVVRPRDTEEVLPFVYFRIEFSCANNFLHGNKCFTFVNQLRGRRYEKRMR